MPKPVLLFIATIFTCSNLFAKIITVSNNLNSPGQYNDLQTAINAAANNDTLLVTGSPTAYGNITIGNKKLTLFGQGYDPRKEVAFPSTIGSVVLNAGSDGTIMSGFIFSSIINQSGGISNITLKRNTFRSNVYVNGDGYLITDNIMAAGAIVIYSIANTLIKNNIFSTTSGAITLSNSIAQPSNLLITNNAFTSSNINTINVSNAVISNNIFYQKSNSTVNIVLLTNADNCIVNNNITYNNINANPFNIGNNNITGSNNQINVNPLYQFYDLSTTVINRNDNLQLQAGSPANNAGTDGTDIGAYGGATPMQYPLSGEPAIPQIKSMNISNTVVSPTGALNVQVNAKSNN